MIIGNGLLANALKPYDREDVVFLAFGVSDSKCTDSAAFEREALTVVEHIGKNPDKLHVYFSTFSIHDPAMKENMYVRRKLTFEQMLSGISRRYLIVRISNLVGRGGNPSNVFNFFLHAIHEGKPFKLWADATRNLILAEDAARILDDILENSLDEKLNSVVHLYNPRDYSVPDIVHGMEAFMGKKGVYERVEKKSEAHVNDPLAVTEFSRLGISTDNYLERILETHFAEYKAKTTAAP
jgi:nucleoside-diphosphate-sugar epimerase